VSEKFMSSIASQGKDQHGMTGLETVIILIAFVVVATVFGYAVLSAGLFSAERDKENIYSGLNSAKSTMELSGPVIAKSTDNISVRLLFFTVRNAIAGNPIDMTPCDGTSHATNKCVIDLTTKDTYLNNVKWTKSAMGTANSNNLLEIGEQFEITIDTTDLGEGKALKSIVGANDTFNLQVKPSIGSTITIQRTLPPAINPVMDIR
jgi:archaeal flagellin FlaB